MPWRTIHDDPEGLRVTIFEPKKEKRPDLEVCIAPHGDDGSGHGAELWLSEAALIRMAEAVIANKTIRASRKGDGGKRNG